jgi:hypothetical protein
MKKLALVVIAIIMLVLPSTLFAENPGMGERAERIDADNSLQAQIDTVKPANRVIVAKIGGNYTSIAAALEAISPSTDNPYLIEVMPGNYEEPALVMKTFVHLRGSGRRVTHVSCPSIVIDSSAKFAAISDISFAGPGAIGILIDSVDGPININDNSIRNFGVGIKAINSNQVHIANNNIRGVGTGVLCESGSPNILYNVFSNIYETDVFIEVGATPIIGFNVLKSITGIPGVARYNITPP